MVQIEHLLLTPDRPCGESESRCPLLRLCPVCGFTFVSSRSRRQHQNGCAGTLSAHIVEAQHEHKRTVHRG